MVTQQNSLSMTSRKLEKDLHFKLYEPPKRPFFYTFSRRKGKSSRIWEEGGYTQIRQVGSGGSCHFLYRSRVPTAHNLDHLEHQADLSWPNSVVHLQKDSSAVGIAPNSAKDTALQASSGLSILRGCSRGEDEVCLWHMLNFPAAVAGPSQGLGTVTTHITPSRPISWLFSSLTTLTTSTINSYPPPQQNSTLQCTHFCPWGEGVRLNSVTDVIHTATRATERCSGPRAEENGGLASSFLQSFLHSLLRFSPFIASTHAVTPSSAA